MSEQRDTHFINELLEFIRRGESSDAEATSNPTLSQESTDFGTLLRHDATFDNVMIAGQLIHPEADIDHLGHENQTALMLAVRRQHTEFIKCLLNAGANIDTVNANGRTAFQMLFEFGYCRKKIVRIFREKLREDSSSDEDLFRKLRDTGLTMYEAAHFKDLGFMQFMLDSGVDINSTGSFQLTALHAAVEQNDLQLAEWLIGKNANVNVQDEDGRTPLLLCVIVRVKKAMLILLLGHGADPNIRSYHTQDSPLHALAICEENTEDVIQCMQLLFEHGAIPHNLSGWEDTIFDGALNSVNPTRVKYLIAQTVFLEKTGIPINVALMRCSCSENQTKLEKLVENHKRVLGDVVFKTLSLFDLLTTNDCGMRKCGRDRTFIPNVQKFCWQKRLRRLHPSYFERLEKRVDEAVYTVEMEDIAIRILYKLFHSYNDALYIAAKKIVGYLDKADLEKLGEVKILNSWSTD